MEYYSNEKPSESTKDQMNKFVDNNINKQYFLIQVSGPGCENILRNGRYKPYHKDLSSVNKNDLALVYFTGGSLVYKKQLKKIYRITDIIEQTKDLKLIEESELNGISLDTIRYAIRNGKLKNIFKKIGQQGFNMIKIDKSDYDAILLLDKQQIQNHSSEFIDYERIHNFINKVMDAKTTYQPIMIRTILENGVASKETIDKNIRLENPNKENNFVSYEVYEVLVDKHKIVKFDGNGYKLNLINPLTEQERNKLIELCSQEILRIRENTLLLEKNVPQVHIDILKKFVKKHGKYLRADEIYGEKLGKDVKKTPLPPDETVNKPHYLHNLITGVYNPANDEYALSIQLNPQSKWELEIDRNYPTLRINYDFGKDPKYRNQISKLEKCYKNEVPVGIIFKTIKGKNKILGLGKIVSFNGTKFVIDSYGISKEESKILKEETIKEFDESLSDPEFSKIEEVNYNEFLSKINFTNDKFKHVVIKSPEPRRIRINQIVENCETGEWVIPRFQRYFDWKKEDIKDFLKSVFLDYYVGALLLWDVRKETELDIMPIDGVIDKKNLIKNAIVLDGQQRITALYYAIKAPNNASNNKGQNSFFYIDFSEFFKSDDNENFIKIFYEKIENEDSFKKMLFPFYNLEHHHIWLNGFEDYLRKQKDLEIQKILDLRRLIDDKLRYIYNGFEIPFVTLPADRSLEQVTEIFEKINSSGIQLDVFDLLIARLSKYEIKLRDMWDDSQKNPKIKEYEGRKRAKKMPIYILHSIALSFSRSKSCKRKDILDIYRNVATSKEDFENKWKEMTRYTLEAIELLENTKHGFGVTVPSELPFEVMIPVLSSLLKEINDKFKDTQKKCFEKLTNWYWTSVFTITYSSAADSQKTSDFKEMIDWFSNDKLIPKSIKKFREDPRPRIDLRSVDQESNAIYKGVLCLIAIKGGYDLDKNRSIENKKYHKDHIFPKSTFSNYENINSILNITWLTSDTNQRIKRAKSMSAFLEYVIREKYDKNEKIFLDTLDSHYINERCYQYLKKDDFENFIKERERYILSDIKRLIGIPEFVNSFYQKDPINETVEGQIISYNNKTPYDILKNLETNLRLLIETKFSQKSKNWWNERMPNDVKSNAELRKIKNETTWPWYENQISNTTITYLDFNDYIKIIRRRDNWNEIFKDIFDDEELISAKLRELAPIRNKIAHSRDLEKGDIERLKINTKDVLICIEKDKLRNNVIDSG